MTGNPGSPRHVAALPMTPALARIKTGALWLLGAIVLAADVTAFAESYNGLREWALDHRLHGGWATAWPLQVDAFILAGEILMLLAAIYGWTHRARMLGWVMAGGGLTASIVWNAGHVGPAASDADHITAAVPPIAAMAGLVVALSVVKHIVTPGQTSGHLDVRTSATSDRPAVTRSRSLPVPAALAPVTPAARSAFLSGLVLDLAASVADTRRAVERVTSVTPNGTPGRLDVRSDEALVPAVTPAPALADCHRRTGLVIRLHSRRPGRPDIPAGASLTGPGRPWGLWTARSRAGRQDVQAVTGAAGDEALMLAVQAPPAETLALAPVTPDGSPDMPNTTDANRAMLDELPSDAARVRAVLDAFGLDVTPGQVGKFLASYGYEIAPESVRSAMRRARKDANAQPATLMAGASR
jgi:hypothetical protein